VSGLATHSKGTCWSAPITSNEKRVLKKRKKKNKERTKNKGEDKNKKTKRKERKKRKKKEKEKEKEKEKGEMKLLLLFVSVVFVVANAADDIIPVYFDQDTMVGSSNSLSLGMALRHGNNPNSNRKIKIVGVGVIAGDSHIKDAVYHSLLAAEYCDAADVPIATGADIPFVNSKHHVLGRMGMYGPKGGDNWLGEWAKNQEIIKIPGLADPSISSHSEHAALLLIELARKYEGELIVVTAGPLTNIALAVRIAPDIVGKIKAVYTMAGAINVKSKFNFWWDAESAQVFLRQNWTKKVIVPIDVCEQTKFTRPLLDQALPTTPSPYRTWLDIQFQQEFAEFGFPMWDELTLAIAFEDIYGVQDASFYRKGTESEEEERKLLEGNGVGGELVKKETALERVGCGEVVVREEGGALVVREEEEALVIEKDKLYIDVITNHGPMYGATLWWENNEKMKNGLPGWLTDIPPWEVITKINKKVFEEMFISVISSDH